MPVGGSDYFTNQVLDQRYLLESSFVITLYLSKIRLKDNKNIGIIAKIINISMEYEKIFPATLLLPILENIVVSQKRNPA